MKRIYYEDGTLAYEGEKLYGKPYGKGRAYWPDGNLCQEGVFGIKGLLEGKLCYPSGKTHYDGTFRVNRNYGPNIPVEGKIYDEAGNLIFEGKLEIRTGGVGYPTIENPKYGSLEKLPVTPFLWEDEERRLHKMRWLMKKAKYAIRLFLLGKKMVSYVRFEKAVYKKYLAMGPIRSEKEYKAYFGSEEAQAEIKCAYARNAEHFREGKINNVIFLGGAADSVAYCLNLMFE